MDLLVAAALRDRSSPGDSTIFAAARLATRGMNPPERAGPATGRSLHFRCLAGFLLYARGNLVNSRRQCAWGQPALTDRDV